MFSGIIEAKAPISKISHGNKLMRIHLQKPSDFSDIKLGDSISVNGVCLTLEAFDELSMAFSVGYETLKITNWSKDLSLEKVMNLERSMKFGDRIHGHIVSGHVDASAKVTASYAEGDSWILRLQTQNDLSPLLWKKGSICIDGVSLTINSVAKKDSLEVEVCLIPETLKLTNLANLQAEDIVNLEADYMAKAFYHYWQHSEKTKLDANSDVKSDTKLETKNEARS